MAITPGLAGDIRQGLPSDITKLASADSDVQSWINTVGPNNTNPIEVSILNTMVAAMKADGSWAKLDRLWIFALGTQAAALVDLVSRSTATLPVAPTFTAQKGFTGNGSSQYISTGYNPTGGTHYALNDSCYGGWIQTNDSRTSGNPVYFGNNTSVTNSTNISRQSATQNNFCINQNAGTTNATMNPTTGIGLNHIDRTGSTAYALYQNGTSVGTGATATNAVSNTVMFALAGNDGAGNPTLFNNGVLASFFAGGSMGSTIAANFYADMHTALTAINATNFP